jgi:hypothetical protein
MVGMLRRRLERWSEEMFLSEEGKFPYSLKLALYTPESPLGYCSNAMLPDKSRAYESLLVASGSNPKYHEYARRCWN